MKNRKMKIFVDCHIFDKSFQGTTSYLRGLYTELLKNDYITFYFASSNPNTLEKIFGKQSNVIYLKYKFKNKFYRLAIDIPLLIYKHGIDFAHFQYIVPLIKNCKFINTIHDVLFLDFPEYYPATYRFKNTLLFKLSAKKSDIRLTVSKYSKIKIENHFGLESVIITPNAVDSIFLENHNKLIAQAYIKNHFAVENFFLFVSRFEPRKNHITLLKVFVEYKHYLSHNLVFVGNDDIECDIFNSYYEALEESIKNKIKIFKKVNFDDLVMFTRAALISIYPSIAEGFGIPPLESIACGTPTICSNTTAMSDFKFINKFQFDPLDEKEINEKINFALNYKDWESVKHEMLKSYNWILSAEKYLEAIKGERLF